MKLVNRENKFIIVHKIGEIFKKMLSNRLVIDLEPIIKDKINNYFFLYEDNYDKDKTITNVSKLKEYTLKDNLNSMLENLISGIHDLTLNEYSVFLLNHTDKIRHSVITKEILAELNLQLNVVIDFFISTYYDCDKVEMFKCIIDFFIDFHNRSNLFPHYKKELMKTFNTKMCEVFIKEIAHCPNEKMKKLSYKFSHNSSNTNNNNNNFSTNHYGGNSNYNFNSSYNQSNMTTNFTDFSKLNTINYDNINTINYDNDFNFNLNQISDTFTSQLSLNEDHNISLNNVSNTYKSINESFPYFHETRVNENKKFNHELFKQLMNFIYSKGELPELQVKMNMELCIEAFNSLKNWVEEKEFSMNYVNSQIEKYIKNSKINLQLIEDETEFMCPLLSL